MKGCAPLLGFLLSLWAWLFGVRCPHCRGLGDLSRGGEYHRCPRCKGRGVLL